MTNRKNEPEEDRDAGLLSATVGALSTLLEPGDFDRAMHEALRLIGEASGADRVYVFENHRSESDGELLMSQRYEWVRKGISIQIDNPTLQNLSYASFPGFIETMRVGRPYLRLARNFTARERDVFGPQEICSLACMPIVLRGELWGFVGVDDCRTEREWTESQLLALKAAAVGLGGAIVRRHAQNALEAQAHELKRQRSVALSLMEDSRRNEQAAARANRSKTIFLAMMSHEIRTPLNGVIGFTDLLLSGDLPESQVEIARSIRSCGENLLGLISDILDISRIESGQLDIEPDDGDLLECMQSVATTLARAAANNRVTISVALDESSPRRLRLDFNRLRQILLNLAGNAVKFTRGGRVEIKARCERAEGGHLRLVCEVADTGAGIAPEDLELIFEPFQQGEAARMWVSGGSGLGLAICRRLVEAMGGTIRVESHPGQGSKFTFDLAAAEPLPTAATERAADREGLVEASPRILVVDDIAVNIRVILSLLKRIGLSADSAANGWEALDKIRSHPYDVVFMDVLMPDLDGIETTRRIRSLPAEASQPWIIALTADAFAENRQRCAEVGMNDFLTKPVRLAEIESSLGRWQRQGSGEGQSRQGHF